jgi:cytochrome P450
MAPAFQPRHITSYADTMVEYGERIQREWRDGEVLDVGQAMTRLTMSIIGKVLFGADVFTEADELGAAMRTALEHVNAVLSTPFSLPFSWPLPRHLRTRRALVVLKGRIQQMIDGRRAGSDGSDDLLSMLLRARDEETGEGMSDQQICDEAITLFFAGHETIATALTWTWYLLAAHPDVQGLVQDEVDRVLQGRSPSAADLERLPYCLQAFKEALRLYPPIHAIIRVARHDLEVGGFQLRRGDTVLISPHVIQHRPDYFPNPERFDPERFTAANERLLPRYAFIPFGAGPRICIGNHFATMEGHLLLATLAQRVAFELVPDQRIEPDPKVTLRPKREIRAVLRRRGGGI